MLDEIFILLVYLALAMTFRWAFAALPGEGWQMIGTVPVRRLPDGRFEGWNLTWYGFFNAVAVLAATLLYLMLMGATDAPAAPSLMLVVMILAVCLPAARMVARLIEKKSATFTVGGASFVGIILAPWLIGLMHLAGKNVFGFSLPVLPSLAAMSVAYALGEGIGRLACISFGCCYGKPLSACSPQLQRLFRHSHFIFTGKTKKISYATALEGQAVIPVQAITAVLYSVAALAGCYLFLKGWFFAAFFLTLIVTQAWRIASEFLRADYRGEGKISGYQILSGAAILYAVIVGVILRETAVNASPNLMAGFTSLGHPALIALLLAIWAVTFIYMGKSKVTASVISFTVVKDKI